MDKKQFETGDLIKILNGDMAGTVGIVSKPISEHTTGHVLVHQKGFILGKDAAIDEIALAGEDSEGFAQLGHYLIKLGSHVIEKKLLVYRS